MFKYDGNIGKEIRCSGAFIPKDLDRDVSEVLQSGWINTGKRERQLREKICNIFNARYSIATTSGTGSLKSAYSAIGIKSGDEVITTPWTFIATNTAILEMGAKPVFADIQRDTLNIDPKSVEQKITNRTKAVVCVHFAGNPVDLDELRDVCGRYNLPLIEDCCHAMGSYYKDQKIGSGELCTFSLQTVKIITCGDGGFVTTSNEEYYSKLKKSIWFGIDREARDGSPNVDPFFDYMPDTLGFKLNMNDITASMANIALEYLDICLERRRYIGEKYRDAFSNFEKVNMVKYHDFNIPNYQIFPVFVEDRKKFAEMMWENNIHVHMNNRRLDQYPIFGGLDASLINVQYAEDHHIMIPCHYEMTNSDVDKVIDIVSRYEKL
jgi:dTDP-4-amino-4,6-dideoxygalactose transaminase